MFSSVNSLSITAAVRFFLKPKPPSIQQSLGRTREKGSVFKFQ